MDAGIDTIAAISTPVGEGGISIVRLSGDEALAIADKVACCGKKHLAEQQSHTLHYGHIVDPVTGRTVDEVLVSVMRAPRTYTRDDIVEINCHGGLVVANEVLELVLSNGARLAEPGEFTERAFLNGRIDLTQAEAVMEIIEAKTERALKQAVRQLDGSLKRKIHALRERLSDTLVQVEVNIDYPEYDEDEVTASEMRAVAGAVKADVAALLSTAKQGTILRNGLKTAIIGRPNVGKSSLLNSLAHEEKAIVTDVAGTTRDTIEEFINVAGVPLCLIDTAGIRETEDAVEKIGVARSRKALSEADLVLLVIDASEPLTDEDRTLLAETAGATRIVLLNKSDRPAKVAAADLDAADDTVLAISAKDGEGIDTLADAIQARFFQGGLADEDATYVTNARHIDLLRQTQAALDDVLSGLELGMPVDLVQIDLTRAFELLGDITGENVPDELITKLFSNFCLGK